MTVCNMSIEAGARAGMIAPDETTYDYLRGREFAPRDFDAAVARWRSCPAIRAPVRSVLSFSGRGRFAASHLGHQSGTGRRR